MIPNMSGGPVAAIGLVADAIGILSFALDLFPEPEESNVKFNFFIGLDGASDPDDPDSPPLSNAGGNLPE